MEHYQKVLALTLREKIEQQNESKKKKAAVHQRRRAPWGNAAPAPRPPLLSKYNYSSAGQVLFGYGACGAVAMTD